MSLCLAGRFFVVSVAGSWPDLLGHAWEASGFFYVQTLPRAQIVIPSEATMLPSVRPVKHHQLNPAGNQIIRQLPRAFESFSRNGSIILRSGLSVFEGL